MYQTILIPTDGSEGVEDAIEEGIDLARLTDATIHALYIVDDRDYGTVPDIEWITLNQALATQGERAVEAIAERADRSGVETVTAIEEGKPAGRIIEYVESEGIDLIVMGTHGRSGLSRLLIGSVTEAVIRRTTVPVHIVRVEDASSTRTDGN